MFENFHISLLKKIKKRELVRRKEKTNIHKVWNKIFTFFFKKFLCFNFYNFRKKLFQRKYVIFSLKFIFISHSVSKTEARHHVTSVWARHIHTKDRLGRYKAKDNKIDTPVSDFSTERTPAVTIPPRAILAKNHVCVSANRSRSTDSFSRTQDKGKGFVNNVPLRSCFKRWPMTLFVLTLANERFPRTRIKSLTLPRFTSTATEWIQGEWFKQRRWRLSATVSVPIR